MRRDAASLPCPKIASSLPSRCARTSWLDELTDTSLAPLRADRCGRPDRHPGHPPRPKPGRWNASQRSPARPARQSLALGVMSSAETPALGTRSPFAAFAAPDKLSRRLRRCVANEKEGQPRAPVDPPRSPQLRPRPSSRGTCGGIKRGGGPGTGALLRLRGKTTHPPPLPVREGAVPTLRPPVGGNEKVQAEGGSGRALHGAGLPPSAKEHLMAYVRVEQRNARLAAGVRHGESSTPRTEDRCLRR